MTEAVRAGKKTQSELDERVENLLRGAIDLHVHSGPSIMPRRLDHIEAAREADSVGMRALLFKDHYYSTAPIVELLKPHYSDLRVEMLSSIVLNNATGGINPFAVEQALKMGARIVWMPTVSADNHVRHGHRGRLLPTKSKLLTPLRLRVVSDRGEVADDVKEVLDLVAQYDAVVSAGHLHISEVWPLFAEATKRGVKRMLVNHPTFVLDGSLNDIKELVSMGVFIEHSTCMFTDTPYRKFAPSALRDVIDAAGVNMTLLGSDLGQANNPSPVEGIRQAIRLCLELGYSDDEVRQLTSINPARLVGLDANEPAASGKH
jgi:hypothetical protein